MITPYESIFDSTIVTFLTMNMLNIQIKVNADSDFIDYKLKFTIIPKKSFIH